jgi:hypothetical protein
MKRADEFYVGWEDAAPKSMRAFLRRIAVGLLILAIVLAIALALAQRAIGVSVFEWGTLKAFSGTLRSQPYPHLLVARPGAESDQTRFSSYYLVNPWKFGLDTATADRLDGKVVSLKGTLIYRGGQTMIEVVPDSIRPIAAPANASATASAHPSVNAVAEGIATPAGGTPVQLGEQRLVGEIVDSKCFLGVMNPGQLITHRACAIRCISGGIPPVLLVRQANGNAHYLLLVSREGRPVNQAVLSLVAEPVEITGEVQRHGGWLILRADPATYRRIPR